MSEDKPRAIRLASDAASIEKRRRLVLEMLFQGTPQTVMAELCGVELSTIEKDVAFLKKQSGDFVKTLRTSRRSIDETIGDLVANLCYIRENAMMEYAGAQSEVGKNGFMNTAIKANVTMAKLLMETGVLPKAGTKVDVSTEHKISFEERFGKDSHLKTLDDERSRRRVLDAVGKVLKITPSLPGTSGGAE